MPNKQVTYQHILFAALLESIMYLQGAIEGSALTLTDAHRYTRQLVIQVEKTLASVEEESPYKGELAGFLGFVKTMADALDGMKEPAHYETEIVDPLLRENQPWIQVVSALNAGFNRLYSAIRNELLREYSFDVNDQDMDYQRLVHLLMEHIRKTNKDQQA